MNYTIFTIPQVTPRFVSVHGPYGDIQAPNTQPTVYPAGTTLTYEPPNLDVWSDDPALRKVLLADPNGTATFADITASFPLYLSTLMSVVRMECQRHILATYPVWYQSNVALGIYGQPIADKLRDDIAAVITESNRCEQLIYENQPYTLNLPVIGG